ncbi:MAG: phage DNA encapsidation protein [Clostridiales bacterium]|nr:phage DNA encapsidation protein [Clostridiales bacterium]
MVKDIFYNGNKLINQKDIDGDRPAIFAVDGNRSDGKTTFFARKLINDFKKKGKKFMLIKRYKYQVYKAHEAFFKLIGPYFFPDDHLTAEKGPNGMYMELYLNDQPCGYVCAINSAEALKEYSQYYCDVENILFDEFQCREYVPDEASKLVILYTSAARGFNQPSRYVPMYMCCNHVSSLNPYYKLWGCGAVVDGIKKGFWRGHGVVVERDFNEKVAALQRESAFNKAFMGTKIMQHVIENKSATDNFSFVEKVKTSKFEYICNVFIDGDCISLVRVLDIKGINYYFSDNVNKSCNTNFTVFSNDHDIDTLLLGRNVNFLLNLKNQFDHGFIRFSSLEVKEKAFAFLSILI